MLSSQLKLSLSYYSDLYDMIVPKDHILRKIRELVDFSFIYDELKNKYCLDNGRNAKKPILLFKYLLLKYLYNLSDNGVVERSRYDMSFKYFLELTPEEEVIHPSLLTKFRKQRLKDSDKDIYLPDEPEKRASLDEYNEYCHELLNTVQESPYSELPTIKEESSMLSEILDNQIDCYDQSIDPDARKTTLGSHPLSGK